MRFKLDKAKPIKNKVMVVAEVDHNDGDYNIENSEWTAKEFDKAFDVFKMLADIIGKHLGLEELYQSKMSGKVRDSIIGILPFSEDYSCCGNNCFGHTLVELTAVYYDNNGIAYNVNFSEVIDNVT